MANMLNLLLTLLHTAHSLFKSRRHLALENLALRQQLAMFKQSGKRPRVSPTDRLFWVLLSKYVEGWRTMLHALHPDTIARWHREGLDVIGVGRVSAGAQAARLLMHQYASSSVKCRRRMWVGALRESTGSYSSLVLRSLKRRSRSTWRVIGNHPHRPGEHSSTIMSQTLPRLISSPSQRPHFVFSMCSSSSAMTVARYCTSM